MFVVSYVVILALHPKLKMNRVIIQRSFGHSLEQLTTINYLTNDQMPFVNINLIKQLKDCTSEVSRKNVKMPWHKCFRRIMPHKTSCFVLVQ